MSSENSKPSKPEAPDAFLKLLSEFESGVGSLKALAGQRQMLQSQLADREQQLQTKDTELQEQSSQIEALRGTLHTREHELHLVEQQLMQAQREVAERKKALEAERAAHEADVFAAKEDASARAQELSQQKADLHNLEQRLAAAEKELANSKHALEAERAAHEADVQTARREASLRAKELDTREADLLSNIEELAEKGAELARREEQLHAHEGDLRERAEQLAAERAQLDAIRAQLDEREQMLAQQAKNVQQQHESLRTLGLQLDARQEDLIDRLRTAEQQTKQVEAGKADLVKSQHALEQAQSAVRQQQQDAASLRSKLDAREQELQQQAQSLVQREHAAQAVEQLRREVVAREQSASEALAKATQLEAECEDRTTQMLHQVQEMQLHADEHEAQAKAIAHKLSQVEQALAAAHAAIDTERARTADVTKQSRERLDQMRLQLETTFARKLETEKAAVHEQCKRDAARETAQLREQLEAKLQHALANAGPSQAEIDALLSERLDASRNEWEAANAAHLSKAIQQTTHEELTKARAQWESQLSSERTQLEQRSAQQLAEAVAAQRAQLELQFSQTLARKLEEQAQHLDAKQHDTEAAQEALLEKWRTERTKLEEAAQRDIKLALDRQLAELESQFATKWHQREDELHREQEQRLQAAAQLAREQSEVALAQHRSVASVELKQAVESAVASQRAAHEQHVAAMRKELESQYAALRDTEREQASREAQSRLAAALSAQQQELHEHAATERDALLAKFESRLRDELSAIDNASVLGAENAIKLQREQMQASFESQLEHAIMSEKSRVQRELAGVMQVLEEYEQLWHVERNESARLASQQDDAKRESQEADHVVGVLRDKLREELSQRKQMAEQVEHSSLEVGELQLTVEDLRNQLARAKSDSASRRTESFLVDPAAVARRKRRLRQMRDLTEGQLKKVREGSEALKHRFDQCELVLRNRSELAAARERVIEAERRVQSRMATSKVGVLMLCAVGTFATVGLLSWAIAKQIAPATYIATSMVAADGRGRTLSTNDLNNWEKYHNDILKDPRFHQFASDRFQRAGMDSLGTATAVTQFVQEHLRSEMRNAGEMKLHLTMQGRKKAERTLDTFTAAMTAFANTNQIQRIDGSVTKIAEASDTGGEPVDNAQTLYGLGILGGLLTFVGGASIIIWRRLAKAKTAFERDTQMAGVLDEAKWGGPKVLDSFKQARGDGEAKKAA